MKINQKLEEKKLQQFQKYQTFFQLIDEKSIKFESIFQSQNIFQKISEVQLQSHNISILKNEEEFDKKLTKLDDYYITIRKSYYHGLIYVYDVIIGQFYLRIKLLNLQRTSDQRDEQVQNRLIGRGGFGTVRSVYVQDKQFAIKRIYFKLKLDQTQSFDFQNQRADHIQIKKSIRQYSIYKICSMLGIGPKIIFNHTFDLICFSDCVQFQMELCESPFKKVNLFKYKNIQRKQFQSDLKSSLYKLHQIKFIHKDIKPENILYSPSYKRFVLADFGMSHTISQQIWEKSFTSYQGTLQYSSQQMLELYTKGDKGYVNLYYNDVYALKIILDEFKNNNESQVQEQLSRNSMSFAQSFSQHISYEINNSEKQLQNFQGQFISQTQDNWLVQSDVFGTNNSHQINTGSSFPILSTCQTNSMEGPFKYASQINFYQAQAIHIVCKNFFDTFMTQLTLQKLAKIVDKVCQNAKFQQITKQVLGQILLLFYPPISNQQGFFAMTNLRNTSRNYGPFSQQTIFAVQQYIEFLRQRGLHQENQKYMQILSNLKKGKPQKRKDIQKDLSISISLNNYRSKIDLTLFYISQTLRKQQISQQKRINIIQHYVKIASNQSLIFRDQTTLNSLISKFINKFCKQNIILQKNSLQYAYQQGQNKGATKIIRSYQNISRQLSEEQMVNNFDIQQLCKDQKNVSLYKTNNSQLKTINYNKQLDQIFNILQGQLAKNNQVINNHNNINDLWAQIQIQKNRINNLLNCYQILYQHSSKHKVQLLSLIFLYLEKHASLKQHKQKLVCIIELQIQQTLQKIQKLIGQSQTIQTQMKFIFIYLKLKELQNWQNKLRIISILKCLACRFNKKTELLYIFLIQNQINLLIQLSRYKEAQLLTEQLIQQKKQHILKQQFLQLLMNKTKAYISLMTLNLQQAKTFYQKSIEIMIKTNIIQDKPQVSFQCLKNLIYIYKKLLIKEDSFQLFKQTFNIMKRYKDKQKQILYVCIFAIQTRIILKDIVWNHKTNTLQDQFLKELIDTIVRVSIKIIYKYSIIAAKKQNTIQNIQFQILRTFQPEHFQPEYHYQLMLFNKYLCSVYSKYLPLTQWLYRTRNLKIAQFYFNEQKKVQGLKYLWIYLQKVFLNVLSAKQSDFKLMNIFVSALISQNSFKKGLYYLKKYMFHIPLDMYFIRKCSLNLYIELGKSLHLSQTKYLKTISQNDFQIMKFRNFDWLFQFQENQNLRIKNIMLKKWIRKW